MDKKMVKREERRKEDGEGTGGEMQKSKRRQGNLK